jgi:hypothetical protein
MQLTEHFNLSEFTHSQTALRLGIQNLPNEEQKDHLIDLCVFVLEPLRIHFALPVIISSGFRCKELNDQTPGSSSTSQHMLGEAADITIPHIKLTYLMDYMIHHSLYDQLILEYSEWVHISYRREFNRREILAKYSGENYKPYISGVTT